MTEWLDAALRAVSPDPGRVDRSYGPVASWVDTQLAARPPGGPLVLGLNGPQGAGKSTLAGVLAEAFTLAGRRAVTVSIDDFYWTREGQEALARRHAGNRLLEHRGYPGTHHVALGTATVEQLRVGGRARIPVYDKAAAGGRGDRRPPDTWREVQGPFDLVIVEGWMLGFRPAKHAAGELALPNRMLGEYEAWNRMLDVMVLLLAPSLDTIVRWRVDAERARRERGEGALSEADARDYIERFLPAYRAWLPELVRKPPGRAALWVELDADRGAVAVKERREEPDAAGRGASPG